MFGCEISGLLQQIAANLIKIDLKKKKSKPILIRNNH